MEYPAKGIVPANSGLLADEVRELAANYSNITDANVRRNVRMLVEALADAYPAVGRGMPN